MQRALIGLGAACLAIAAGSGWARLRSYASEDPRFCASCHKVSPEFTLWSGGGHGRMACQKCHHTTPEQGVAMLGSFLSGGTPRGPHAPVEIGACATCHRSHDKLWIGVASSRGHRVHAGEQKIACVRCHGGGVHRFEPSTGSCRGCHGERGVQAAGAQKVECLACHDFLSRFATPP